MTQKKRVGLLGGSFNPPHEGHIYVSKTAIQLLGLDEVWWLVSPQNPLKSTAGMAPFDERVENCRKIVRNNPKIVVSTIESEMGTRYTVDSIKALQKKYSSDKFIWLMGADNLAECHKWKDWEEIFNSIPIAVFERVPYKNDALASISAKKFAINRVDEKKAGGLFDLPPPAWVYLNIAPHPASSTEIRKG